MKRNWSSRMMFSYFPIFLLTVSILVFLSFLIVGELSRSETSKANRVSTEYVVDALQKALTSTELAVLQDIETNRDYDDFLSDKFDERTLLYDMINDMRGLLNRNELIESVYLYREADAQVLTLNGLVDLAAFPDRAFIEANGDADGERSWSDIREIEMFGGESPVKVISMGKQLPLPFGSEGMIVVNLSMYRIEQMIGAMTNSRLSFMNVVDHNGELVFSLHRDSEAESRVLNRVEAERVGWTFESGIAAGELYAWMSLVTYIWIGLGIFAVVAGTVYILYITRKNYKPIQVMMNRLQNLQLREEVSGVGGSELVLIDRALEALISQTVEYRQQYDENLLVQRRQLFLELMEGEPPSVLADRLESLDVLPISLEASRFAFVAAEINGHADFRESFDNQEQNVLKLTLMNLLQEMAAENGMPGWAEWVSGSRLGLIVTSQPAANPDNGVASGEWTGDQLRDLADAYISWIDEHLGVSLTIAIGSIEKSLAELPQSRAAADGALRRKLSMGRDMVVVSGSPDGRSSPKTYRYLRKIADLVREFRLADEGWRARLQELFEAFRGERSSDEEIHVALHLLMQMLDREIGSLSDGLARVFGDASMRAYYAELESQATLEQVHASMLKWLAEIYRIYVSVNESKSYRAMISEMKTYIEENFDNADLSLKHLSDRFQISGKYASYLFKEEFDMKFVDFLTQLRIQRAEYLLSNTSENVQDIARTVGYSNAISFGRVFKRVVGITPGDYRRMDNKH